MATVSNNNSQTDNMSSNPPSRRGRKVVQRQPSSDRIAAQAAAIYPDTFDTPPSPEEIAAEAYAIYQARGGEHGRHEDDWYEAERRCNERRGRKQ